MGNNGDLGEVEALEERSHKSEEEGSGVRESFKTLLRLPFYSTKQGL